MTDAELKRIEDAWEWGKENLGSGSVNLSEDEVGMLLAEVKRLKKIEDLLPDLENEHRFMRARNERLQQENERLKKALEFYVKEAQGDSA